MSKENMTKPSKRVSGQKFTREDYNLLLNYLRQDDSSLAKAGRELGFAKATVRKYYIKGDKFRNLAPIREVINKERIAARAKLLDSEELQDTMNLEKARLQAIAAKAAEGEMVKITRDTVSQTLGALMHLNPGIQKLASLLDEKIRKLVDDPEYNPSIHGLFNIISKYTYVFKETTAIARQVMEMDRLHLGEPTEILGLQLSDIDNLSMEDCMKEIKAAAQAIKRAEENGISAITEDSKPNGEGTVH